MKDNLGTLAISEDSVISMIYQIREMQVMLDFDLAKLYDVETKQLKRAIKGT
jgi:hypothetical protein